MPYIKKNYPILSFKLDNASSFYNDNLIPDKLSIIPSDVVSYSKQQFIDYIDSLNPVQNLITDSNLTIYPQGAYVAQGSVYGEVSEYLKTSAIILPLNKKPTRLDVTVWTNASTSTLYAFGIFIMVDNKPYRLFGVYKSSIYNNTCYYYHKDKNDSTAYPDNGLEQTNRTKSGTSQTYTYTDIPLQQIPFVSGKTYLHVNPAISATYNSNKTSCASSVMQLLDIHFD